MGYKETLKQFWQRHLKSFVKTYITVFLGIYLVLHSLNAEPDLSKLLEIDLFNVNIIAASAKGAMVSFLRNIYKMLSEK